MFHGIDHADIKMTGIPEEGRPLSPSHTALSQRPSSGSLHSRNEPQTRTPLRDRSKQSSNENLTKGRRALTDLEIFSSTPFPTKSQHVLLPSTLRKQKSFQDAENQLPDFLNRSQQDLRSSQQSASGRSGLRRMNGPQRAPVLQLKKSVSTLRDIYEAQERSSRPSTATTSPGLRPMSSNPRLRSASSSDGLSGRYAWEKLHHISADDMALLPTLDKAFIRKMNSQSTFASGMTTAQPLTSSPNYRLHATPISRIKVFKDEPIVTSESVQESSSSGLMSSRLSDTISSSPNFVRLGHSSSMDELDTTQQTSSPNFVKLGTTSPQQRLSSSPTGSDSSSKSLKRKREDGEPQQPMTRPRLLDSTPPYIGPGSSSSQPSLSSIAESVVLPSSPPRAGSTISLTPSSPLFRFPVQRSHSDSLSSAASSTHSNLQAALSSSPLPPIQYPVVRAPSSASQTLMVPKRQRSDGSEAWGFPRQLSPVPSEWEGSISGGRNSRILEELAEELGVEAGSFEPHMSTESVIIRNESQVHIIPDEDHLHEASDELKALPRARRSYRSPPTIPLRTNSLYGTLSTLSPSSPNSSQVRLGSLRLSIDSRLNSMRSLSNSRSTSLHSSSQRPTSSGSQTTIFVPTWARRYYSGMYHDSFHGLNSPNQSVVQIDVPPSQLNNHQRFPLRARSSSVLTGTSASRRSSTPSWHSFRKSLGKSFRKSMANHLPDALRPRLEARKSHLMMGIGPLVSNPTNPDLLLHRDSPTIRQITAPTSLADPRAHWAGSIIDTNSPMPTGKTPVFRRLPDGYPRHGIVTPGGGVYYYIDPNIAGTIPPRLQSMSSPHLHHDVRLDTGSTMSHGYGHPFNGRPRFYPPNAVAPAGRPSWFSLDLRSTQVTCFILGFLCPFAWFVGAVSPLPQRPVKMQDIEKQEWDVATNNGTRMLADHEEIDVIARLRQERHAKGVEEVRWQNARWWRRMNSFMSIVGIVVIVLVIVLAVVGTKVWH